jgi:hypothetical protein
VPQLYCPGRRFGIVRPVRALEDVAPAPPPWIDPILDVVPLVARRPGVGCGGGTAPMPVADARAMHALSTKDSKAGGTPMTTLPLGNVG